jgi:hypothetical protein
MAFFEYEDEQGAVVELEYPLGQAPGHIGDVVEIDGRKLKRLPPGGVRYGVDESFSSWQTPLWDPRIKHHLPDGRGAFQNTRAAREYSRKTHDAPEGVKFNVE